MMCKYCHQKYKLWNGHVCQHYKAIAASGHKIKKALPKPKREAIHLLEEMDTVVTV